MYEMFGEETIAIIYNNLAIHHSCHPYVWVMGYLLWGMGYGL